MTWAPGGDHPRKPALSVDDLGPRWGPSTETGLLRGWLEGSAGIIPGNRLLAWMVRLQARCIYKNSMQPLGSRSGDYHIAGYGGLRAKALLSDLMLPTRKLSRSSRPSISHDMQLLRRWCQSSSAGEWLFSASGVSRPRRVSGCSPPVVSCRPRLVQCYSPQKVSVGLIHCQLFCNNVRIFSFSVLWQTNCSSNGRIVFS